MPTFRLGRTLVARVPRARVGALAIAALAVLLAARLAAAQGIPERLADSTFWRMMTELSEPGGYFRSDNFISNETSFQWVIPELQRVVKPGGVYLGVAPDQNFTYLVALRPKIAFIVDIRHQNAIQHLMYKALFELSADRADFVSRLFSRARPKGLDTAATVVALFQAFAPVAPDSNLYKKTFAAIKDRLTKEHQFALTDDELRSLDYVFDAFYSAGPDLTYNFGQGRGGYGGFGRGMPSYQQLMMESDGQGVNRAYLASEANYRVLKDLEARNLVVPLTGNFAGDKAVRAVGQWVRERGATVTTFYTSNVEQYLFQQGDEWHRWHKNVAALPLDSSSTFIRSLSQGGSGCGAPFRQQSPWSRSIQLLSSMTEQVKAYQDGRVQYYCDVILLSRQ